MAFLWKRHGVKLYLARIVMMFLKGKKLWEKGMGRTPPTVFLRKPWGDPSGGPAVFHMEHSGVNRFSASGDFK